MFQYKLLMTLFAFFVISYTSMGQSQLSVSEYKDSMVSIVNTFNQLSLSWGNAFIADSASRNFSNLIPLRQKLQNYSVLSKSNLTKSGPQGTDSLRIQMIKLMNDELTLIQNVLAPIEQRPNTTSLKTYYEIGTLVEKQSLNVETDINNLEDILIGHKTIVFH